MKLLDYINTIAEPKPNKIIMSVTELTDEEFRHYTRTLATWKAKQVIKPPKIPREKAPKEIKPEKQKKTKKAVRTDTGKKRMKYDSSLPKNYISYLKRANAKGLQFELTLNQWEWALNKPCVYCGGKSTGIDRIESSKGYIIGNMQPCCGVCNMMKLAHSEKFFLEQVEKIYKHRQKGYTNYY